MSETIPAHHCPPIDAEANRGPSVTVQDQPFGEFVDDFTATWDATVQRELAAGYTPAPCPTWCELKEDPSHQIVEPHQMGTGYILEMNYSKVGATEFIRYHNRNFFSERCGNVDITQMEIREAGVTRYDHAPELSVRTSETSKDMIETADEARRFAAALLVAADKLDEIQAAQQVAAEAGQS